MCTATLWLASLSLLICPLLSCYVCFANVKDSLRLCWGHVMTKGNVRSVDRCFRKLDRIFNTNKDVIEAARVGKGFDIKLKEILDAEILPIVEEFDKKLHMDTVYESRLQTAADNFIAAASKLPRVSGCFPPCGFQSAGAVYNCDTCQYDSCEFPLDCPVTPQLVAGHTELQEIFDLSLLPGGKLRVTPSAAPHSFLRLLLFLLTTCLTTSLVLLFLSLGVLYCSSVAEVDHPLGDLDEEDYFDL